LWRAPPRPWIQAAATRTRASTSIAGASIRELGTRACPPFGVRSRECAKSSAPTRVAKGGRLRKPIPARWMSLSDRLSTATGNISADSKDRHRRPSATRTRRAAIQRSSGRRAADAARVRAAPAPGGRANQQRDRSTTLDPRGDDKHARTPPTREAAGTHSRPRRRPRTPPPPAQTTACRLDPNSPRPRHRGRLALPPPEGSVRRFVRFSAERCGRPALAESSIYPDQIALGPVALPRDRAP
jgi:hypothetical protein